MEHLIATAPRIAHGYATTQPDGAPPPPNPPPPPSPPRHYLADAVFTIAVTGPTPLLERIAHHLEHPRWAPYLGRRNCIPTEPLVLATSVADPMAELTGRVPLSL
ncbi:type I-E CRISPR-associated protein Cas5/CasD, partial [Streptomyces regalis]|uniref:type I-E CRISPR-associated protein Cas5/CasD n=1 Tax=Streptomyces regalis TaxID=68262 RepID=UPI0024466EFA